MTGVQTCALPILENLYQQKLVSEREVDVARFAHKAATVEHRVKEAAVAQAAAARKREQVNLDRKSVV